MAGMLLQWLGQNAREITLIAHIDTRQDELLIQATITPLEQVPLLRALQSLEKKQIVLPASYWGKLRGKTPEQQQHAREQAFRNGEEDSLYLTMHGGETLQFQAAMKGTLLAYHAALDAQEQPARPRRERPWPRRPRRDPHIILQPSGPPHGIMPGNFIQGQ
ncbi:MAG TPA: hypothetical protein PKD72_16765, partial [Gemmatales bacterium]|nr:hypothetical protein [Gemmatales bacterium]